MIQIAYLDTLTFVPFVLPYHIHFFTFYQKEIELPLHSRLSVYMNISYQNIDVIIRNLR